MRAWPFDPPVRAMETKVRVGIPEGACACEPGWDGIRAVAWSDEPRLDSCNRQPLQRYFPGLIPALDALPSGTMVEVSYDQLTGGRFRYATRFEPRRPDKDAGDCTTARLPLPRGPGFGGVVVR